MSNVLGAGPFQPWIPRPKYRAAVLSVGISQAGVCGVRDYGHVLSGALAQFGSDVEVTWLDTEPSWGIRRLRAETGDWLGGVDERVESMQPDWVIWHYSVFSYGYRGLPILSHLSAKRLAKRGVPVVGVLHELAYPFGQARLRGFAYAVTQRVALRSVYGSLAAAVVTSDIRADWLGSRAWLPRRPLAVAPVFANVGPSVPFGRDAKSIERLVGVIGFASERYLIEPIVEAVRLAGEGRPLRLMLIGSPGADSPQGRRWRTAANRAGIGDRLTFSGILDPSQYAEAIASIDLVVFPDADGPSSRKTTLAAALAAGKPVVAIDGPERWNLLADDGSVLLVSPDPSHIAEALTRICDDEAFSAEQGRRAVSFYNRYQTPQVTARRLVDFLSRQSCG